MEGSGEERWERKRGDEKGRVGERDGPPLAFRTRIHI